MPTNPFGTCVKSHYSIDSFFCFFFLGTKARSATITLLEHKWPSPTTTKRERETETEIQSDTQTNVPRKFIYNPGEDYISVNYWTWSLLFFWCWKVKSGKTNEQKTNPWCEYKLLVATRYHSNRSSCWKVKDSTSEKLQNKI